MEASKTYGALGELAIMVMPQPQISAIIKKLDLGGCLKDFGNDTTVDLMATIKDPLIKEIIAKEALHYKPKNLVDQDMEKKQFKAAQELLQVIMGNYVK